MKPTWKNTMHDHHRSTKGMEELAKFCYSFGYTFILWNDRIYKVFLEQCVVTWAATGLTIDDMEEITFTAPVVIACRAADGCPVLVKFDVSYTNEEMKEGDHYDKAIELAEDDGYEAPFICFDVNEQSEIKGMVEILD